MSSPAKIAPVSNGGTPNAPRGSRSSSHAPATARALLRVLAGLLIAVYFIAGLGYLGLRYLVWPQAERWMPQVEQRLGEAIGRPVSSTRVRTGFDGIRPWIEVEGLEIRDPEGRPAFSAQRVQAVLSLRHLVSGRLRFADLHVHVPRIKVTRLSEDRVEVAGFVIDRAAAAPQRQGKHALAPWLLTARRLTLSDAEVDWVDQVEGRSLRIPNLALELGTVGRRHRVSLQLPQVPGIAETFELAGEIWRPAFSRFADWRQWSGQFYAGAERIELPAVVALVRGGQAWIRSGEGEAGTAAASGFLDGLDLSQGVAAFRSWFGLRGGSPEDGLLKLASVQTRLSSSHASLPLTLPRTLPLELATFEAELVAAGDDQREVLLRELVLRDDQGFSLELAHPLPPDKSRRDEPANRVRLDRDGRVLDARIALQRFEPGRLLAHLPVLPVSDALRAYLSTLQLEGFVEALALELDRVPETPDRPARLDYTVEARLEALSARARDEPLQVGQLGIPSFEGLSGTVAMNREGGRVSLLGRQAVLRFPGLFAEPAIPFDRLEALASWRTPGKAPSDGSEAIDVEIERLHFENVDAAGELSGRYRRHTAGLGDLELSGRLVRADATRVARYLPLKVPAEVRDWVRTSVLAGHSDDVRFELHGPIADFPYDEADTGRFRIESLVRDGVLEYASGWPSVDKLQARLVFEPSGTEVAVETGRIAGLNVRSARARIEGYEDARLRVAVQARGAVRHMLDFVEQSPLASQLERLGDRVSVGGEASLEVDIRTPLEEVEATRVKGSVVLSGNDLALGGGLPGLTQASGRIDFTERKLALRGVSAGFLGGSLRIDGESDEDGHFEARLGGRVSADALRRLADNPVTRALEGATDWSAELALRGRNMHLRLDSELRGLTSHLPAPFTKGGQEGWPLRVEFAPRGRHTAEAQAHRDRLQVTLRDDLRLALDREFDADSQTMQLRRGVLAASAEPLMPDRGFAVRLDLPNLDLDAWSALLGAARPSAVADPVPAVPAAMGAGGKAFSFLPSQVSVSAGRLRFARKNLNEVVLGAVRNGGSWRANLSSREIDGLFDWRAALPGQPVGALSARLTRLEIPPDQVEEFESLLDHLPQVLPGLDVVADEFILNEHRLGRLRLQAVNAGRPDAPIWRLDRLAIEHPAATLEASGTWQAPRAARLRSTKLGIDLRLRDAGQVLETLGFPGTARGGAGQLAGTIEWVGSPLSIDYPTLAGDLRLDLGKGQLLKADPGIAKLIGVINLQSLRRRLSFDFRDLFAEGFAFDRITGSARLSKGRAYTEDFAMRGTAAQVRLRGSADLAAETQDLQVEVRPELNAGLASLAYAALANPAIGLGSFVAQLLLREPLQQLFAGEYEVTGSWYDPQVTQKLRPLPPDPPPSGG